MSDSDEVISYGDSVDDLFWSSGSDSDPDSVPDSARDPVSLPGSESDVSSMEGSVGYSFRTDSDEEMFSVSGTDDDVDSTPGSVNSVVVVSDTDSSGVGLSDSENDEYGHWIECGCGHMHPPVYPGRGTMDEPFILDFEGDPPLCPEEARRLAEEEAKRQAEEEARRRAEEERMLGLIRSRIKRQRGGSGSKGSTSGHPPGDADQ